MDEKNIPQGTSSGVQWLRLPSNAWGMGSIPDWGTKISHASGQKPKNQYCNKFNKDFNAHLKKKKKNIAQDLAGEILGR